MTRRGLCIWLFVALVPLGNSSFAATSAHGIAPASLRASATEKRQMLAVRYNHLPLSFERNRGQADAKTEFVSRGQGYTLLLSANEAVLSLRGERSPKDANSGRAQIRLRLVGADAKAQATEEDKLPGKTSYLFGNDPRRWVTGVENYARVSYKDVYPGVDLVYYGKQRQIEHDFVVAPGSSPDRISLGIKGTKWITLSSRGDLVLSTQGGEVQLEKPVVYQEIGGKRRQIAGSFVRRGKRRVGFRVGDYDHSRPLVIDPILSFSTFYGGFGNDEIQGIAVDSMGNIYAGGGTQSPNLTLVNPIQSSKASFNDGFLLKLDPTASTILYSTYIGGNGDDEVESVAVDQFGNLYATGITASTNFPTVNAVQPSIGGGTQGCEIIGNSVLCFPDAFVLELNAGGNALVYSTYLGGSRGDQGNGIAVDGSGNVYVVGSTQSPDFHTTANAFETIQGTTSGNNSAFITKLDPTGNFVYSTYLDGTFNDTLGSGIAIDANGDAFVTGLTEAFDFPTVNPLQLFSGFADAFVTELNPAGSALVYSSLFGGRFPSGAPNHAGFSSGNSIALDPMGNIYVAGTTNLGSFQGDSFPVVNAFQSTFGGNSQDAFVFKLNATGTALIYSTYLGGRGNETATGIAADGNGNVVVGGFTDSLNFPVLAPIQQDGGGVLFKSPDGGITWQASNAGLGQDTAFVVAIDPTNPSTLYAGQGFLTPTPVSKSLDAGATWTAVSAGLPDDTFTSIIITPTNTQTLYAAGSSGGVFLSTDGGGTWNSANNGLSNTQTSGLVMDPQTPSILYVATNAGVFKTMDGATTWTLASSGLPVAQPGFRVLAITRDPAHAGTLYASVRFSSGGGVYKTADGANSWSLANNGIASTFIDALAVDPVTTSIVYAGTDAGYFKSIDGGSTWTAGASQFNTSTIFAFAIDPANTSHILMSLASFSFSGPKNAFVTTDGGATWKKSTFTNNLGRFSFDPTNSSTIYAAALNREDQFIARFDPSGTLLYSTYLGGTGTDEGHAVAVDASGNGIIAGFSDSANFPTTAGTIQPNIDPPSTNVGGSNGTVVDIGSSLSTRIVLSSDTPSVIVGQPFSVVATVTPKGAIGIVHFTIVNALHISRGRFVALSPDDTATFNESISLLPVLFPPGEYTITAQYLGDDSHLPSDSLPISIFVLKDSTVTTVAVAPAAQSVLNYPIVIVALVVPSDRTASGTPTGTVTFFEDGIQIGAAALDSSGFAVISFSRLTIGKHVISAKYLGDSNHSESFSNPVTQMVLFPGSVDLVVSDDPRYVPLGGTDSGQQLIVDITNYGTATACIPFRTLTSFTLNGVAEIPNTSGTIGGSSSGNCSAFAFELVPGATQAVGATFPAGSASRFSLFVVRGTISYTNETTGVAGTTTFSLRGLF